MTKNCWLTAIKWWSSCIYRWLGSIRQKLFAKPKEWQIPSHRLLIGPRGRSLHQIFLHTYLWFVIFSTLADNVLQKLKRKLGQGGLGPLLKSISSFQFLYWIVINHHSDNKNNQTRSISISVFAVSNNETRSTSTSRPFCSMLFGGRRTKSIVYS